MKQIATINVSSLGVAISNDSCMARRLCACVQAAYFSQSCSSLLLDLSGLRLTLVIYKQWNGAAMHFPMIANQNPVVYTAQNASRLHSISI